MQYLAILLVLSGLYLVDSGVKNRDPVGFLTALIKAKNPDLRKTLAEFDGKWTTPQGYEPSIREEGAARNQEGLKTNDPARNGRLTASELTAVSFAPGQRVSPSAAPALDKLNAAFKTRFNRNLTITDSYRSYAQQVAVKAAKGPLAATPGTSNHGLGLAVDLGGGANRFGTPEYEWLLTNAPAFGWVNPDWAKQGGNKPEPWHWEYVGTRVGVGGSF